MITRVPMTVAVAILAMLVAGCGGNAKGGDAKVSDAEKAPSVAVITARMRNAMTNATSVHIDGSVTRNGLEIFMDVSLERSGSAEGVILTATPSAVKSEAGGLNIIVIDSDVYFEVTPTSLKVLKARASLCRTECGKFVKLPDKQAESIVSGFTLAGVLGGFTGKLPPFTRQGTTIVNGVRVTVLRAVGTTIDVAAAGTPFPVVVDESGSFGNGKLVFTNWNAVPAITAPQPTQIVTLTTLAS